MDASAYALVHGLKATRAALGEWRERPCPVLGRWLLSSLAIAALLLVAIWVIASFSATSLGSAPFDQPPFAVGDAADLGRIVGHNLLVLALHAMACVAGFIAGSSLPLQAQHHTGLTRLIHERGRPVALTFVVCATGFSLSWQAYALGTALTQVASALHTSTALLLVGLLPHAVPELVALFLPLAAWIVASRRGEWDRLLAATLVTVAIAVPMLVASGFWEVYVAPHLLSAMFGYSG